MYKPGADSHWKPSYPTGLEQLAATGRIHVAANSIQYRRFASDCPYKERGNLWTVTLTGSFTDEKMYVVQTNPKVVERCLLMTSDPGDLVLDPTCGSGTTAWCAEKWGRRWITGDTSRIPVALARQRMLTGTFDFFRLQEPERGPTGGFEYRRRRNRKGEEVGGIVPHITLESIANKEPAKEEVLVDRPEKVGAVLAQRQIARHSGLGIANSFGIPDCLERVHWGGRVRGRGGGSPAPATAGRSGARG